MMGTNEVFDHFGQIMLLRQFQSVGNMTDDNLGALFIT